MTMPNSDEYIDKKLKESNGVDLTNLEKARKKKKENPEVLSKHIRKVLLYSGFIGAIISATAYLIITLVMITGAKTDLAIQNQILFSIMGAIVGLFISFLLRSQGIIYAKQNPEAILAMKDYRTQSNKAKKTKQLHTIIWFVAWATVRDIFLKGATVAISTWFVLYIFIEGSGDWRLLGLAISNILMFSSFGVVSLATMYEKYLDDHIPSIIARTKRLEAQEKLKQEKIEKEKLEKEKLEQEKLLQIEQEKEGKRLLQLEIDKEKAKLKAKAKKKNTPKKKTKKKPTIK